MRGFSLVELSIVLVILGLLVGGILAGQSLIRASELRSVTTDHQRYYTAMMAFKDRYFGLPGDISNATLIWGKNTTVCNGEAGVAGTPGTCNGTPNGLISGIEGLRFWQQLSLAGLIEGNYTGTGTQAVIGTNIPALKVGGGIGYLYSTSFARNAFWLGNDSSAWMPYYSFLKPEEAWNLDAKTDDGVPNTGKVRGIPGTDTAGTINCHVGNPSRYSLSVQERACYMLYLD